MTAFVWVIRYSVCLAVAGSPLLADLVLVFDVHASRSLQIIDLTTGPSAVTAGRWIGGQAVDLTDGLQATWLADVSLFNCDGVGVCTYPTPQWSERTVVDDRLRWTIPNLVFDRGVDLDAWEVTGMWIGSLPGPVLVRALGYLWYSRKQLEPKVRKGESLEANSFAIVRAATIKTVKHVVRTFGKGTLPDNGDALHTGIDSVFEDFDLDGSDSTSDEDPTEWTPGDGNPASDPLAGLDQRRKQHAVNGEPE